MITREENISLNSREYSFIKSGWGDKIASGVDLKKIHYLSDNIDVEGFLAIPKNIKVKIPLIIWNRGGFKESGKLDNFLAFGLLGEIASWGYAVLASQYRSEDEFGGSDVNDILELINLANGIEYIDTDLIGMEGWSRGGMMTYLTLTKTDSIKCAVIISGLANLIRNRRNSNFLKLVNSIYAESNEENIRNELMKRSAVNFADKVSRNTSILFIHGDKDERISYLDSEDMYYKLSSKDQANYELKIIENGGHFLKSSRKYVSELRQNWFSNYLK
jgi:dipeptidyl aminopeptidase/acylaminoacyl peptidase